MRFAHLNPLIFQPPSRTQQSILVIEIQSIKITENKWTIAVLLGYENEINLLI